MFLLLTWTSYGVLLQGKFKHLTAQYLLPSVQPCLAKGGLTWECVWLLHFGLAPAKHLKMLCKTQGQARAQLSCWTRAMGEEEESYSCHILTVTDSYGPYPYRNVIYCKSACCIRAFMLHALLSVKGSCYQKWSASPSWVLGDFIYHLAMSFLCGVTW